MSAHFVGGHSVRDEFAARLIAHWVRSYKAVVCP
jgi:hypothetical protein